MEFSIGRLGWAGAVAALVVAVTIAAAAPAARAQDRAYWIPTGALYGFAYAALDGSGGGSVSLETPETDVAHTTSDGLTIDTADGRFIWSRSYDTAKGEWPLRSIGIDGTGQRRLDSGPIKVETLRSLTIDPAGRWLIWNQNSATPIEVVGLDGGGGGGLVAPGLEVQPGENPVIFDAVSRRVYWIVTKGQSSWIDWAAIDGSGGEALPVSGRARGGLAIDEAGGRIYWVSAEEGGIMSMKLDGTDQQPVAIGGAPFATPFSLAIDEATRTLYWANSGAHAISFAKLDGSGAAGQLNIAGAPAGNTADLVLFVAPRPLAAPVVSGAAVVGGTLGCSTGRWAPDQTGANLFDAAVSYAYQWTRDGAAIPGATAATLIVPAAFDAVTLALAHGPVRGGAVKVTIENFNPFAVSGDLGADGPVAGAKAGRGAKKPRPVAFRTVPFTAAGGTRTIVALRLPAPLRKRLRAEGRLKLKLSATVTDPLGAHRKISATAVAKSSRSGG